MGTAGGAGRARGVRVALLLGVVAAANLPLGAPAPGQTPKVKVGRTTGASGFHLPTYVAMDRGIFKAEGLDAEFVNMTAGELVRGAIAKEVDFAPVPGAGAEAMLKGAPLVFVVGESLVSQWTLTTTPEIKKVEDLRGKTLGLGRPGSADYSEAVVTLGKFFKLEAGKDFKVIFFRGEPERVAALLNGSIQGAALSFPHAARAEAEGLKVLVRTGDYTPRLGGTISTHRDNLRDRREMVKKFVRAIVKSIEVIRTDKPTTLAILRKHFNLENPRVAENLYTQMHDKYGAQIPPDLFHQLFESVATPQLGWPEGKPLPDVEQFVARDLLTEVLKETGKPVN
jgi:ABC-type nitrate/sulfonate/bicarbonate transport system substrate-binding protein